jgi:hypothetical protein
MKIGVFYAVVQSMIQIRTIQIAYVNIVQPTQYRTEQLAPSQTWQLTQALLQPSRTLPRNIWPSHVCGIITEPSLTSGPLHQPLDLVPPASRAQARRTQACRPAAPIYPRQLGYTDPKAHPIGINFKSRIISRCCGSIRECHRIWLSRFVGAQPRVLEGWHLQPPAPILLITSSSISIA